MSKSVFISYAGRDRAHAEWVASTLKQAGHHVWLDLWDIHLGDNWLQRIQEGLARASVVVAIYPSSAGRDSGVVVEWHPALLASTAARKPGGPRLVLLALEPLEPNVIPHDLRSVQWVDLSGLLEFVAAARLRHAVGSAMQASTTSAPSHTDRNNAPRLPTEEGLPSVWNVSRTGPEVTGRDSLINEVRHDLMERGIAILQQLRAQDDVGKDEIAQEYAYRFASQYDIVWWVEAGHVSDIRDGYTRLAHELSLKGDVRSTSNVDWLFSHLRHRWLVIFSDAGNPNVIDPWLPPREGHILITSYDPAWLERDVFRPQFSRHRKGRTAPKRAPRPKPRHARPRVLAVATEWESGRGGLSTFNRQLCQGLAALGSKVFCLLPDVGTEAIEAAAESGVTLLKAARLPVWSSIDALYRKPALAPKDHPDIIIGHGRVTGMAAQLLAEDHFPSAKRLHIIHVAPDELEWHRPGRVDDAGERAYARTWIELELGRTAHRPVVVGPRLYSRYLTEFEAIDAPLPLRIDPGFESVDMRTREPSSGAPLKILLLGRAEDEDIKGLDLAARAMGLVAERRGVSVSAPIELVVRGAPPSGSENLRNKLRNWSGNPSLSILVRPYVTQASQLAADLRSASLVIMPSRAESFGLVGAEAITAGTPLLASGASGLAALLKETLGLQEAMQFIVELSGDATEDSERWSRAVEVVLADRVAAFQRAGDLRNRLAKAYTWAGAAAKLLAEID
ncbi:TIR domain-containing protein [Streptomyces sp. NPDC093225]|uniref:TIR domain-containing protein n=1 Tax=Streptomyces sp. NPDC093225 TaxID=3366034 RepID=UPI0038050642